MPFILLLFLSSFLVGCAAPGVNLSQSDIETIKQGSTTQTEVEKRFGKPKERMTGPSGKTVANYASSKNTTTMDNRRYWRLRCMSLIYDEQNVVERVIHHEWTTPIHSTFNGYHVGIPFTSTTWITEGKTTMNELITVFGPAHMKSLTPSGSMVLCWVHFQKNSTEVGETSERLMVELNDQGVVTDFLRKNYSPW